jgi:hypothetical protein
MWLFFVPLWSNFSFLLHISTSDFIFLVDFVTCYKCFTTDFPEEKRQLSCVTFDNPDCANTRSHHGQCKDTDEMWLKMTLGQEANNLVSRNSVHRFWHTMLPMFVLTTKIVWFIDYLYFICLPSWKECFRHRPVPGIQQAFNNHLLDRSISFDTK